MKQTLSNLFSNCSVTNHIFFYKDLTRLSWSNSAKGTFHCADQLGLILEQYRSISNIAVRCSLADYDHQLVVNYQISLTQLLRWDIICIFVLSSCFCYCNNSKKLWFTEIYVEYKQYITVILLINRELGWEL